MRRDAREEMLQTIIAEVHATRAMTGRAELAPAVIAALRRVPREEFVPADLLGQAFANHPLPIGSGQTISQPFMVAIMTDLLDPQPQQRILEVGTGSGYQAAVLAELVGEVCSLEVIPALAAAAAARLERLGYRNIAVRTGDGYRGWPERAPFDGIVVTAAAPAIPPALVAQLKPEGRLVIPVGEPFDRQVLQLLVKDAGGQVQVRSLFGVAFVPLVPGRAERGEPR